LGIQRPLAGRDICGAKIAARMQGRIVRRTMLQQEAMIERTSRVYLWKAGSLKLSSAGTEGV
jgi:hypothetical protein